MKIWIFSNVAFTAEEAPEVGTDDLLVFLNKATGIAHYANHARKVVYHRAEEENYGAPVAGVENRYVFGANRSIPGAFVDRLKQSYDWNYEIEPGRVRCMTTGYMVAKWLRCQYPDAEIALVNFGFGVKNSTYRCPWHNWKFEAEELAEFKHFFTAKTANGKRRKRVFYELSGWLGDNVYASAVVANICASRQFAVNVSDNWHRALWEHCPYLTRSITRENADVVIRQRYLHPWTLLCPPIIQGVTDAAAFDLGTGIETRCRRPRIWVPLPKERPIEQPYVLLNAGWQNSAPTKKWAREHWEKLIALCPDVHFAQMGQSKNHAVPLAGAESWIDRTENLPDLLRLVRDAACVVSPPSGVVHIAAAYRVPVVMLSGGREPSNLAAYPETKVFSACGGRLDCCKSAGCHRNAFGLGENECGCFRHGSDGPTAQCMLDITPEEVAETVLFFFRKEEK